ncbi:arginine--tRNA ligase, partial [Salmonella enterica subsp. enterica serovar Anatum]|nr:arginine--tRNA ligase [Salmonella enterica subsp. enterica serovar Anatum]
EGFYRDAKKHYDEDEAFAERARNYVVRLQSGDTYFREMWRKLAQAQRLTAQYEAAREKAARLLNAPDEKSIVWTRGTTEAINMV